MRWLIMGGVISAGDPKWIEPVSGLTEVQFARLVAWCGVVVVMFSAVVPGGCRWRTGCCWWPLLAHESDIAAGGAVVRGLEVCGRPHPRSPRPFAGALAGPPAVEGQRLHRRRHPGATRDRSVAASSKNCRYSTNCRSRSTPIVAWW